MVTDIFEKSVRAFFVFSTILIVFLILKYAFIYVYPFFIILIISSLLHPLVSYIQHTWKLSRAFATLLTMGSFFTLLMAGGYIFFAKLTKEAIILLDNFPARLQQLKSISHHFMQYLSNHVMVHLPMLQDLQLEDEIRRWIDQLTELSIQFLSSVILTSTEIIHSITYTGFVTLFIVIAIYMVTKDFRFLSYQCRKMLPSRVVILFQDIFSHMKYAFAGLIKAQIMITFLSTLLICVGLFFFRTDHLLIITLIIFIVDFIPYLGIGVIFIPWILYSFFTNDYTASIQLSSLYAITIVFRQFLEPKLIADKIGIHPFIALSVLFMGIQLFGVIGLFLTPLCLIFISAFYRAGLFHLLFTFIQNDS